MWDIEYADPAIAAYIDRLSATTRAKVAHCLSRLQVSGNLLGMPLSRSLSGGLFELRTAGRDAQRLYFAFLPGQRIVVLQIGSKKTQAQDMALARGRMRSVR